VICKVQTMVVIRQSIQEDNVLHIKIINFKVTANASRSVKLWYSFTFVFSRGFDFSSIFKSMHFCRLSVRFGSHFHAFFVIFGNAFSWLVLCAFV